MNISLKQYKKVSIPCDYIILIDYRSNYSKGRYEMSSLFFNEFFNRIIRVLKDCYIEELSIINLKSNQHYDFEKMEEVYARINLLHDKSV